MSMISQTNYLALAACFLLSGCTTCGDYKHLEFIGDEGARITESRVPNLSGLSGVSPFPVEYVVNRDSYQLVLRADETTYGPTIVVSVKSSVAMGLKMNSSSATPDGRGYCFSYDEAGADLRVAWFDNSNCETRREFSVTIEDAGGTQVSIEKLPFEVVTNGRYCTVDAL